MTLQQRSFHDGKLHGFCLMPNQQCTVFVADVNGLEFEIHLSGVYRIRADDFREGNIILDISSESGRSVKRENIMFALSIIDERHSSFVDGVLRKVEDGMLTLIQINPSYGCSFACLCAEIEVSVKNSYQ